MEDMIRSSASCHFLVCVDKTTDFEGIPVEIAAQQRIYGTGVDFVRISGKVFFALSETLSLSNSNETLQLGMTTKQFDDEVFNHSAGTRFSSDSCEKMTFSWLDTIALFFEGSSRGGVPTYSKLFWHKGDIEYAHQIFRQFTKKLWGDGKTVTHIYGSYQKRIHMTFQQKLVKLPTHTRRIFSMAIANNCAAGREMPRTSKRPNLHT